MPPDTKKLKPRFLQRFCQRGETSLSALSVYVFQKSVELRNVGLGPQLRRRQFPRASLSVTGCADGSEAAGSEREDQ